MSYAKHETFHLREGWLYKGMNATVNARSSNQLPTIFLDDDAPERLGIGRNMVRALRFWMQATGLAQETKEQGKTVHVLTDFGNWVWHYDPYLDDVTTLWLIHYHLVSNKEFATTWYWCFNHFPSVIFDANTCFEALQLWALGEQSGQTISQNSLKKDVSCLIRTYLPGQKDLTPEELTESPLARLKLFSQISAGAEPRYRKECPDFAHLHPLVVLYVLIDNQHRLRYNVWQVGLSQVLREPQNAGRVFNLTSAVLSDILISLNKLYPDWMVKFERTAGLDQLTLPAISTNEILTRYATEHKKYWLLIGIKEVAKDRTKYNSRSDE